MHKYIAEKNLCFASQVNISTRYVLLFSVLLCVIGYDQCLFRFMHNMYSKALKEFNTFTLFHEQSKFSLTLLCTLSSFLMYFSTFFETDKTLKEKYHRHYIAGLINKESSKEIKFTSVSIEPSCYFVSQRLCKFE